MKHVSFGLVGPPFRCVGSKNWGAGGELGPKIFLLDSSYVARRALWVVWPLINIGGTSDRASERINHEILFFTRPRPKDQDKTKERRSEIRGLTVAAAEHCRDRLGISDIRPR